VDVYARLVAWPQDMVFGLSPRIEMEQLTSAEDSHPGVGWRLHFLAPPPPKPRLRGPFDPHTIDVPTAPKYPQLAVTADRPFPNLRADSPCAPLPFASDGVAVAAPVPLDGGPPSHAIAARWALRTTAYFEVTIDSEMPRGGGIVIGLADCEAACPLMDGSVDSPEDAPLHAGLGLDGGHSFVWRLDGPSYSPFPTDGAGLAQWAHATEPPVSALLGCDKHRRPTSQAVPVGATKGDTVGCGLDYSTGHVFWTRNGTRVGPTVDLSGDGREAPALMHVPFWPVVGASGDVTLRVDLAASSPYVYSVREHELRTWAALRSSFSQKQFFEEQCQSVRNPALTLTLTQKQFFEEQCQSVRNPN
jgi:hypothetical protein